MLCSSSVVFALEAMAGVGVHWAEFFLPLKLWFQKNATYIEAVSSKWVKIEFWVNYPFNYYHFLTVSLTHTHTLPLAHSLLHFFFLLKHPIYVVKSGERAHQQGHEVAPRRGGRGLRLSHP